MDKTLVTEILRLGVENNGSLTDPSESEILQNGDIIEITDLIRELSLHEMISETKQIIAKDGMMWTAYKLSDKGLLLGMDSELLNKFL